MTEKITFSISRKSMKEKSEIHINVVFELSLRCVLKGKNKVDRINHHLPTFL